jgi:hypothetical protein
MVHTAGGDHLTVYEKWVRCWDFLGFLLGPDGRTVALLYGGSAIRLWVIVGNMNVETDDLKTTETDDRGRVYLGTQYANKRVTVAVVDVESDGPDEEELAEAYRDAAESAESLTEQWDGASEEAWADRPE